MKKVTELSLSDACKEQHIPIHECGGVFLRHGDKLLVLSSIAARMVNQYRGRLVAGSESEVERLRGGHYQHNAAGNGDAPKAAPKKVEAKKEEAPVAEQKEAEEGQVSDRSMGDQEGKPKRKAKKKASRKG